jgi:hypothetical protein
MGRSSRVGGRSPSLGRARWKLIRKRLREIAELVAAATPGSVVEIEIPLD